MIAPNIEARVGAWLDQLNASAPQHSYGNVRFEMIPARSGGKYSRIVQFNGRDAGSVHAFVDMAKGQVFKPASWKGPAKGARYDLNLEADFDAIVEAVSKPGAWAGGYLHSGWIIEAQDVKYRAAVAAQAASRPLMAA